MCNCRFNFCSFTINKFNFLIDFVFICFCCCPLLCVVATNLDAIHLGVNCLFLHILFYQIAAFVFNNFIFIFSLMFFRCSDGDGCYSYLNDLHPRPIVCLQLTHLNQHQRWARNLCLHHEEFSFQPWFLEEVKFTSDNFIVPNFSYCRKTHYGVRCPKCQYRRVTVLWCLKYQIVRQADREKLQ